MSNDCLSFKGIKMPRKELNTKLNAIKHQTIKKKKMIAYLRFDLYITYLIN